MTWRRRRFLRVTKQVPILLEALLDCNTTSGPLSRAGLDHEMEAPKVWTGCALGIWARRRVSEVMRTEMVAIRPTPCVLCAFLRCYLTAEGLHPKAPFVAVYPSSIYLL